MTSIYRVQKVKVFDRGLVLETYGEGHKASWFLTFTEFSRWTLFDENQDRDRTTLSGKQKVLRGLLVGAPLPLQRNNLKQSPCNEGEQAREMNCVQWPFEGYTPEKWGHTLLFHIREGELRLRCEDSDARRVIVTLNTKGREQIVTRLGASKASWETRDLRKNQVYIEPKPEDGNRAQLSSNDHKTKRIAHKACKIPSVPKTRNSPPSMQRDATGLAFENKKEAKRLQRLKQNILQDIERLNTPEYWQACGEAIQMHLAEVQSGAQRLNNLQFHFRDSLSSFARPKGQSWQECLDLVFNRRRRSKRGQKRAQERLKRVQDKLERFERTRAEQPATNDGGVFANTNMSLAKGQKKQANPSESISTKRQKDRNSSGIKGVRAFKSRGGIGIYVGSHSKSNHALTFRFAKGKDLWLHWHDGPSPHVIIRAHGLKEHQEALLDACALCQHYSSQKEEERLVFRWCERRLLRPVKGQPGKVISSKFQTIVYRYDQDRIERLLRQRDRIFREL